MDLNRRVSSAGYRLPERNKSTRPKSSQPAADRSRHVRGDKESTRETLEKSDTVKQDQVWKEVVWGERRGVKECLLVWALEAVNTEQCTIPHREKNWGFLRNYDQMGQLKPEKPLPSYVPLFSDCVPNTTNQMCGSRLSTPLGSELVRLDRLLLWSAGKHKRKLDPEMLPC